MQGAKDKEIQPSKFGVVWREVWKCMQINQWYFLRDLHVSEVHVNKTTRVSDELLSESNQKSRKGFSQCRTEIKVKILFQQNSRSLVARCSQQTRIKELSDWLSCLFFKYIFFYRSQYVFIKKYGGCLSWDSIFSCLMILVKKKDGS